ncbi:retention module-containing protein, partial [Grimontia sp. S25]
MDSIITKQAAKVISVNGNAFIKVNGKDVPIAEVLDLNAGTEIFIPEGANALLSLEDGTVLPVGEQDSPAQDILGSPLDDEIAAIQALIEEGVDPTEVLEATAAGGNAASGAGSWSFQSIGRAGEETIAQAGFDTQASARSFLTAREVREDSDDSSAFIDDGSDITEPTEPSTPTSPEDTTADNDGDGFTVSITSISQDTGLDGDFITNDNTLVISGVVDLGDENTLTVTFDGTDYTSDNDRLAISQDGTWTLDVTGTQLADGDYSVKATVTDSVGNSNSAIQTIVIDTEIGTDGDKTTKAVSVDSISEDSNVQGDFVT